MEERQLQTYGRRGESDTISAIFKTERLESFIKTPNSNLHSVDLSVLKISKVPKDYVVFTWEIKLESNLEKVKEVAEPLSASHINSQSRFQLPMFLSSKQDAGFCPKEGYSKGQGIQQRI